MIGSITDPVQCMDLCIAETSFVCRVAELYKTNSYCLLYSDVTFSAQNPNFNPSVSYDHYMRDCAASNPHPPTPQSTSVSPTTLPQTTAPPTTPPQTSAPPSSVFSFCVDNIDCAEILDAECRYEKCQCLPGLSHDPAQNSCIQGRLLKMETLSPNIHRVILTVAGLTL